MALYTEWGWDVARTGALGCKVTDDGGAFQLSITTGTFLHSDISTVFSAYTDFATTLKAALDAASPQTYTVTYTAASQSYTITCTGTVLTLEFSLATTAADGTRLRRILGMTGNRSGTAAGTGYSSQMRPYYSIVPAEAGRTAWSGPYMPAVVAADAEADDGSAYGVARGTAPRYMEWVHQVEPIAAVYTYQAAAEGAGAAPWTWEDAFVHAQNHEPFLVVDGSDSEVHKLRADGVTYHPQMMDQQDYTAYWIVPFRTRLLGRL